MLFLFVFLSASNGEVLSGDQEVVRVRSDLGGLVLKGDAPGSLRAGGGLGEGELAIEVSADGTIAPPGDGVVFVGHGATKAKLSKGHSLSGHSHAGANGADGDAVQKGHPVEELEPVVLLADHAEGRRGHVPHQAALVVGAVASKGVSEPVGRVSADVVVAKNK